MRLSCDPAAAEVPDEEYTIPLGQGAIKREGTDVTIICWNKVYHKVMEAAEELAQNDINVEVLDPMTLQPLDEDLICSSVAKTHRAIIVEEAWGFGSVGSEISNVIYRNCFDELDAPVVKVTNEFVPMPYNEAQEERVLPSKDRIVNAVKEVLYI